MIINGNNEDILEIENIVNHIEVKQLHNKNQYVIRTNCLTIFQSYESIIAFFDDIKQNLYIYKRFINYSKTTNKHLYIFINEYTNLSINNLKDLNKAIKRNQVILIK